MIALIILGGLLAGGSALNSTARSAIVPALLGPELLRSGMAFSYGSPHRRLRWSGPASAVC